MQTPQMLREAKKALYGDRRKRPPRPQLFGKNLPASLRDRPQWVGWKFHWDDYWDKLPKNPHSDNCVRNAKSNDPTTWADLETTSARVKEAVEHNSRAVDGFGYVFVRSEEPSDDDVFGLDLDCCRDPDTGELTPLAARIVKDFATYAEVSPSQLGIKLIGRGRLPMRKGMRKKLPDGQEVELYDWGRFFTLTGARVEGAPPDLTDCRAALAALVAEFFGEEKEEAESAPTPRGSSHPLDSRCVSDVATVDDLAVIKVLTLRDRKAEWWKRLFEGDASGYASQSEADQALCNKLAFYCRGHADQIDRVFRLSGLYREK
jgi:putative DNA primase/helicase